MLLILIISLATFCSSSLVIKPPSDKDGLEAGFILIQGAQINATDYNQFALQLQSKFAGKLWVSIPEFPLSVPEPILISQQISTAFDGLKKAGCNLNKDMPFFFAGHSLGGIIIQDYMLDNNTRSSLPVKFSGLILEGAYIERKNRDKLLDPTIPNILTIGGELDGLNRITRMTESYYFNMKDEQKTNNLQIITLLVKGMNHYQFAGEGEPPFLVKQNDIKAEITDPEARDQITSIINSFMKLSLNASDDSDKVLLQKQLAYTASLVNPILEAFQMEGYYHTVPPCYKAPAGANCSKGCPWTQTALSIMASSPVSVLSLNEFRPVQNLPPHLPFVFNNCSQPFSCTLNVSTITDNIYATGESFDTALQPIAATEMRTKLSSRQAILRAATGKVYDFNETDGSVNTCSDINKESLNWAMKKAPEATLQRYIKQGKHLVMGSDIGPLNMGPLWIWTALSYTDKVDSNTNTKYTEVRSPTMKTPLDYYVKAASAFHYCKVLSPARAIEWIYVDSIKP